MKKYKGTVSTGYVGSTKEFEFEVDETCEDVEEKAFEAMCEEIDWGYEEIKTESDDK